MVLLLFPGPTPDVLPATCTHPAQMQVLFICYDLKLDHFEPIIFGKIKTLPIEISKLSSIKTKTSARRALSCTGSPFPTLYSLATTMQLCMLGTQQTTRKQMLIGKIYTYKTKNFGHIHHKSRLYKLATSTWVRLAQIGRGRRGACIIISVTRVYTTPTLRSTYYDVLTAYLVYGLSKMPRYSSTFRNIQ